MPSEFFLGIWDDDFLLDEAESQLATAVDWGRYAELFEYHSSEGRLYLPGNSAIWSLETITIANYSFCLSLSGFSFSCSRS
jgi:hypothetical protein